MKVEELYDGVAREYEDLINSPKVNAKLLYNLKNIFDKYKIVDGSILDLGCGPGNLKTILGNNFSYTGIDISPKMLEIAKEKGWKTIKGKIEDEIKKIADKSFDHVISLSAIYFIKDIDFIISELNRITRNGWIISLADITPKYAEYFSIYAPLYNHTGLKIDDLSEDLFFDAWTSPNSGDLIKERIIFKKF